MSQIGQGLETLAFLLPLEQAWYAGETHASCGRVLAAYEAAAEQALLLAHRGAGTPSPVSGLRKPVIYWFVIKAVIRLPLEL